MKFKYFFALVLILAIIFSLGTAVAGENLNASSTQDTNLSIDDQSSLSDDEIQLSAGESENQDSEIISDATSDDEVDLSVNMELGDVDKDTYGIGETSFDVPLIITVKVTEGVSKNTKVTIIIPENFTYISNTKNIGEYNPETGIWNIGDLNSDVDAILTIQTQINTQGTFIIYVNATTDSMDMNLSNNNLECHIQVSSKITSNTTRTSANQGTQHTQHQGSDPNKGGRENAGGGPTGNGGNSNSGSKSDEDKPAENGGTSNSGSGSGGSSSNNNGGSSGTGDNSDPHGGSNSASNGGSSNSGSNSASNSQSQSQISSGSADNVVKEINLNVFDNAVKSIDDTINSILNPDSDDEDSNASVSVVKAIDTYDYSQIPYAILAVFLIALIGILAYDKIKT